MLSLSNLDASKFNDKGFIYLSKLKKLHKLTLSPTISTKIYVNLFKNLSNVSYHIEYDRYLPKILSDRSNISKLINNI